MTNESESFKKIKEKINIIATYDDKEKRDEETWRLLNETLKEEEFKDNKMLLLLRDLMQIKRENK